MSSLTSLHRRKLTIAPAAILQNLGRWKVFLAILAVVALTSLLYVNQTGDLASAGYDVADLQNQKQQLEIRHEQLQLQVDQLIALDRVDHLASTRLNLGPPQRQIYVAVPAAAIPPPPATPQAFDVGTR
jgi:cell division protein FtsL